MNFFDAQDRARRATRWLVLAYLIAAALIVAGVTVVVAAAFRLAGDPATGAPLSVLVTTAAVTALLIAGATLYKIVRLSAGGGRVALDLGGTLVSPDTQDPLRRRLRNIVEEMAIASGLPVPEIYLLDAEPGINAFAAGYQPGDAAIAVTRGALELLERDELQGVVAHEFSHILNGDMRLNIRMMGVLFGILALGLIGRVVLRGGHHAGWVAGRRSRSQPAVMAIGLGLVILGWIGMLFARMVKAAVSRQRELLADASAVQFTRQTSGIADALKKIGGYAEHSVFRAADPEEVSHMLFADGLRRTARLFATHPPLIERIRALDPAFDAHDYPQVVAPTATQPSLAADEGTAPLAAFAGAGAGGAHRVDPGVLASVIGEAVGQPAERHVAFARRLRRSVPADLYDAAHSPELSLLLAVALAMHGDAEPAQRQLHIVRELLGDARTAVVKRFHTSLASAGPAFRLPLLEIAAPVLRRRPVPQIEMLLRLVERLIEVDGDISVHEFCLYRVLESQLAPANAASRVRGRRVPGRSLRDAAAALIALLARQGSPDPDVQSGAYAAGAAVLGRWAPAELPPPSSGLTVERLNGSLDLLTRARSADRLRVVRAVCATIVHDAEVTVAEAELLRAVCAGLGCPLPPLLRGPDDRTVP